MNLEAFAITGVGGFVLRQPDDVIRVLQFVLPSGELLSIGLSAEQLEATVSKAIELQTAELETGEVMHSIGLSSPVTDE